MKCTIAVGACLLATWSGAAGAHGMEFLLEESLVARGNVYGDATGIADRVILSSLAMAGLAEGADAIWRYSLRLGSENYFATTGENTLQSEGRLAVRLKGSSSVLDLLGHVLFMRYAGVTGAAAPDATSYTHLVPLAQAEYRLDFDTSSLYLTGAFSRAVFPDYDLDDTTWRAGARWSLDLGVFTTVEPSVSFTYRGYLERYLVDAAGAVTGEAFRDLQFDAGLEVRHHFNAACSVHLAGRYSRLASNGNFYFYGPGETTLAVDGDELLLPDYYSRGAWTVRGGGELLAGRWRFTLAADYERRAWVSRRPFTALDTPVLNTTQLDRTVSVTAGAAWRAGDAFTARIAGTYRRIDSNNAKTAAEDSSATLGCELRF